MQYCRIVYSSEGLDLGESLLEMDHSGVKRCICNGRYFKTGLKCVYKRPEILIILGKPKYIRGHYRYFYSKIDFEHAGTCYRSISLYDKPNQFLRERLKSISPREKIMLEKPSCRGTCCGYQYEVTVGSIKTIRYKHSVRCWTIRIKPYLLEHLNKFIPEVCINLIGNFLQLEFTHSLLRCNECGIELRYSNISSGHNRHQFSCPYTLYQNQYAIFQCYPSPVSFIDFFYDEHLPEIVVKNGRHSVCINSPDGICISVDEDDEKYKELPEDIKAEYQHQMQLFHIALTDLKESEYQKRKAFVQERKAKLRLLGKL